MVSTISLTVGVILFLSLSYLMSSKSHKKVQNEPKWFVFTLTNYLFILLFVFSFTYVMIHYKQLRFHQQYGGKDSEDGYFSLPLMVALIFSGCSLGYLFGFFGVSFVSENDPNCCYDMDPKFTPLNESLKLNDSLKMNDALKLNDLKGVKVMSDSCAVNSCLVKDKRTVKSNCSEMKSTVKDYTSSDDVIQRIREKEISLHQLEKLYEGDMCKAIEIRRQYYVEKDGRLKDGMDRLPFGEMDYTLAHGRNCENMIGYVQVPVGLVGPVKLNGENMYFPMATTEGCLVASTNRGCKAIMAGEMGVQCMVLKDGITRAPCVRFQSAKRAALVHEELLNVDLVEKLKLVFDETTRFGKMKEFSIHQAGRNLYLRISCMAGDAMGMNMVSKGTSAVLEYILHLYQDMEVVCVSGNVCTDKKPSAMNWVYGRGKSVVAETTIPKLAVEKILKSNVKNIVDVHIQKNLIGSAVAGCIGGNNAHAANLVAAIFLATGQDPAQVVESANCLTHAEINENGDLYMSVTMPSIEVGTIGGGTHLPSQASCLEMLGIQGASTKSPGLHAKQLAKVVATGVLAGEVSLLAALAAGDLVKSHMKMNRKH